MFNHSKAHGQVLNFFITSKLAENPLFMKWANQAGHRVKIVSGLDDLVFLREWNRCARAAERAFIFDYPVESETDLVAIEKFVEHVLVERGAWYYAPRPNAYIEIEGAAMVGAAPATVWPMRTVFANFAKPIGKRLIYLLPAGFQKPARRFARHVYERIRGSGIPLDACTALGDFQPTVKTPASLAGWSLPWRSWQAPDSVLTRDLLDRVETFFPHPLGIHVIVLNKCNLACVMCPYHSPVYREAHTSGYFDDYRAMQDDTFRRVAEYAARNGIGLQFGQIEEVLVHRRALDFFEMARDMGVPHMHLTTNGTLLSKEKSEQLARSGIKSVMFSIDAVDPGTYKKIRGDDLEKLEENIAYFMPLARKVGISVAASFILQPLAMPERNRFLTKWRALGVDAVTFYVLTEHDKQTGEFLRPGGEMYKKGDRYPCASPWVQTVVFPDGEISLCCKTMTDVGWRGVVSVGNVREQSFDQIWAGGRYRLVRSELLANVFQEFDVCRNCEIWSASTSLVEDGHGYRRTFNETMETYQFL